MKKEVSIVVLSKYQDIFEKFEKSVSMYDPIQKILVRTGDGVRLPQGAWHTYSPDPPFCFARYANQGISAALDNDVIICNDDITFLDPQMIEKLQDAAYMSPSIGIVSPKILGGAQAPQTDVPGRTIITTGHFLAFVCVYIKRDILDTIGPLDERYDDGYGYEDVDYCVQVRRAGYELAVTGHTSILHGTKEQNCSTTFVRTFQNGYVAAGARNRDKFFGKWGGKPLGDIWNG